MVASDNWESKFGKIKWFLRTDLLQVLLWKNHSSHLIVTARACSTAAGYVFTGVCLFNFRRGGTLSSWQGGGLPHPSWPGWGVPHPRSRWGYPIQLTGDTPFQIGGTPCSWWGIPNPRSRLGVPHPSWGGLPLIQDWMGYPPTDQHSIAVCLLRSRRRTFLFSVYC